MTIERLQKQWRDSARFRGLHAAMSLEKEGLVLGAKTLLAKRDATGALALEGAEQRLLTLLAVAHGRPVDASVLGNIRRASKHARAGDEAMAAMHIALARLPKLADTKEAARRLFIADGLIEDGVDPRVVWTALEFPFDEFEKLYNSEEPRVPQGSGRVSGEWTSESDAGESESQSGSVPSVARQIGASAARAAVQVATGEILGPFAGSIVNAFFGFTDPAGVAPVEGTVPGRPDLRFTWSPDENTLRIFSPAFPHGVLEATLQGNEARDRRGRKVARILTTSIQFELGILPPPLSATETDREQPRACPISEPDRPGAKPIDRDYEDFVKEKMNKPPTARGWGYWLTDPTDGNSVVFDDCRRSTDTLIEIKRGYGDLLDRPWGKPSLEIDWVYQATREVLASGNRDIEWHFSDKAVADFARETFSQYSWLKGIRVVWTPWDGGNG